MKKCCICNTVLEDNEPYCHNCGSLEFAEIIPPQQQPEPEQPQPQQPEKEKKHYGFPIIFSVFTLLYILFIIVVAYGINR